MKKFTLFFTLFISACSQTNLTNKDSDEWSYYQQKAVEKYGNAELSNDPQKINRLGILYDFGFGMPENREKAKQLYLQAGALGYGSGYCNYSATLIEDKNIKDYKQIISHYILATKSPLKSSCGYKGLGMAFYNGYGVKPNLEKAKEFLLKSIYFGEDNGESEYYLSLISLDQNNTNESHILNNKAQEKGYSKTSPEKNDLSKLIKMLEL